MQQKMLIPYSHLLGLIQKISISITFVHNIISETNKEGILVRELTSSDVCILFAKGYPFTSIESWSLKKEKNSFVKFSDAFLLIPPKVKSDIYCCWWTMLCSYHLLLFNTQLLWALKNFFRTKKWRSSHHILLPRSGYLKLGSHYRFNDLLATRAACRVRALWKVFWYYKFPTLLYLWDYSTYIGGNWLAIVFTTCLI